MITGKTVNLAVIGEPITHTLSPSMHNAAIADVGIDYVYTACPVRRADLQAAVHGFAALGFRGYNVTIPHKEAILPLLDAVDDAAKAIGAVNTVVIEEGRKVGYNTDVAGFLSPFYAQNIPLQGKKAVVFGAGGAARSVLYGLLLKGVSMLTVGARNEGRARAVSEAFSSMGRIVAYDWHADPFQRAIGEADLIVNTTPLGMHPREDEIVPIVWTCVKKEAIVYDLVYTPAKTRFLREAEAHGCMAINGESMLVGQGAEAFFLWTGVEPNRDVMAEALRSALKRRA